MCTYNHITVENFIYRLIQLKTSLYGFKSYRTFLKHGSKALLTSNCYKLIDISL